MLGKIFRRRNDARSTLGQSYNSASDSHTILLGAMFVGIAAIGSSFMLFMLENKPATISRDETCGEPLGRNLTNQTTSTVRSKFLEISSTTYIENKQYTEF